MKVRFWNKPRSRPNLTPFHLSEDAFNASRTFGRSAQRQSNWSRTIEGRRHHARLTPSASFAVAWKEATAARTASLSGKAARLKSRLKVVKG